MDLIRTRSGTGYLNKLVKKDLDINDTEWSDMVNLSALGENFILDDTTLIYDFDQGGVTEDSQRQSLRRLFEAGMIEEV